MPLDGTTRRAKANPPSSEQRAFDTTCEQRALRTSPAQSALRTTRARSPSTRMLALRAKRDEQSADALEIREAQAARRKGETRWEAAIKRGIKSHVIPDFSTAPEPVGTNRVLYIDGQTQISLFVAEPIEGLDHLGFIDDLLKANVDPKLVKRLSRKHRTETRPAHRLTSSPVG